MASCELRLSFPDRESLERELAQNLRHGRAFLAEAADVAVLADCVLVLCHPEHGRELRLPAQVVMVSADGPMTGTGLALRPFAPSVVAQLEEFVASRPPEAPAVDADEPPDEGEHEDEEISRELSGRSIPPDQQLESKQEKLRHLSLPEQLKLARAGELADRIVVERLYGKQVWEALLHNPRLSVPEVARIARKGTVPKPLLEVILDNSSWIKTPQVRRALLGNPKVTGDAIQKLLRVTPKHELKQIEKGTAYSMPVRDAARKLLKQ